MAGDETKRRQDWIHIGRCEEMGRDEVISAAVIAVNIDSSFKDEK